MKRRDKQKLTGIYVDGDSLQVWASKTVGRKLNAADIRALVSRYGRDIDYFLHICDKQDEKAARVFERDGLRVHRTDLSTDRARAYRPKAEEALELHAIDAMQQDIDHVVLVTGVVYEALKSMLKAATHLNCRATLLAPNAPKKIVLDEFVKLAPKQFGSKSPDEPLRVFISYSHKDEALRERLETSLALLRRQNVLSVWHDRQITAGDKWAGAIDENLESADIILLLVSPDFIASDYCHDIEMDRAMKRHAEKTARVVPIIVRDADWESSRFASLQALPKGGRPVTLWPNSDSAWKDVAVGIRETAADVRRSR